MARSPASITPPAGVKTLLLDGAVSQEGDSGEALGHKHASKSVSNLRSLRASQFWLVTSFAVHPFVLHSCFCLLEKYFLKRNYFVSTVLSSRNTVTNKTSTVPTLMEIWVERA